MTQHARSHCPDRLTESFWLPSCCRNGLATATRRLDALVDADQVEWDGGDYASAHYRYACCGTQWCETWPAALVLGPNWRERGPVRWMAGVDSPRHTAAQIASDAQLAG